MHYDALRRFLGITESRRKNAEGLRAGYDCSRHFFAYRFSDEERRRTIDRQRGSDLYIVLSRSPDKTGIRPYQV